MHSPSAAQSLTHTGSAGPSPDSRSPFVPALPHLLRPPTKPHGTSGVSSGVCAPAAPGNTQRTCGEPDSYSRSKQRHRGVFWNLVMLSELKGFALQLNLSPGNECNIMFNRKLSVSLQRRLL